MLSLAFLADVEAFSSACVKLKSLRPVKDVVYPPKDPLPA
jgi:hypothetical protein